MREEAESRPPVERDESCRQFLKFVLLGGKKLVLGCE